MLRVNSYNTLIPEAPATAGDFYFSSRTNKPLNQPPIPDTIARN